MADTQVADVVVPEIFGPYVQQLTEQKSRLIQSGAVVRDAELDQKLAGGGLTFNAPSWQDLADDDDNVSDDVPANTATPNKTQTSQEVGVRLSRNQHWSSMDLAAALAGADPMMSIADRVAGYWARRQQAAFVATMTGIFADNTANDSGDYTNDLGASVSFSASGFLGGLLTMGDSMEDLAMIMVHSVVFNKMQNANLIVYRDVIQPEGTTTSTPVASTAVGTAGNVPVSRGEIRIPTYLGRQVIVDDGLPSAAGVYESWIFGAGAVRFGQSTPRVPVEVTREALTGNGGGQEILSSRVEWAMHPVGHAYTGTAPNGGPSNAATANNLGAAGSWDRVYPERKQIKIARILSDEN